MSKKLQAKFNNTLKIFSTQLEENKQKQEQIIENFELSLDKDNENLKKITEQIKEHQEEQKEQQEEERKILKEKQKRF